MLLRGRSKWHLRLVNEVMGQNAYEIQECCTDYTLNKFNSPTEQGQLFKKCAYEHGIKLEQVLEVCAVKLRDQLLRLLELEDTR